VQDRITLGASEATTEYDAGLQPSMLGCSGCNIVCLQLLSATAAASWASMLADWVHNCLSVADFDPGRPSCCCPALLPGGPSCCLEAFRLGAIVHKIKMAFRLGSPAGNLWRMQQSQKRCDSGGSK
jgi:hypothetical protein